MGTRRQQRLRHRQDIAAVYRRGRVRRGELVTIRALSTKIPESRFGFAVGVPVGNAVTRNRVRRRLREIMRAMPVAPGWDLMLTARPAAREAPFQALRGDVQAVLQRLGALA